MERERVRESKEREGEGERERSAVPRTSRASGRLAEVRGGRGLVLTIDWSRQG